jgi:hypothetical protein
MTAATRYFRPEVTKVIWTTGLASYTSPTRAEINSGIDVSGDVAEINGFQVNSDTVDTPDLGTRFTSKIPGRITADDSSLNLYASRTGGSNTARTLFPRDSTGYIIIMDGGDVATTGVMDVFPVTVSSRPKLRALEDPAMEQVQFTITRVPAEDRTIPG